MGSAPALAQRRTWAWIGAGSLLSVLMRLRMFWSPVTVDEGGYLAIARAWAHGKVLYRDVWVDRPQGLLALFRLWDWLSGGSTASIRIMAMLFGIVLVVATAVTVRELVNDIAARWAAIICGVISAAPVLEGHTANGELLSGALSAAGLAVAAVGLSRARPPRWFFGSGVLAGLALSLKQSGFDGLLALGGWLVVGALLVPRTRRSALRSLGSLVAGLSSVLAVLMIHGALTGWSRWWTAVAGYRLRVQSGFASAEWSNLARTFPIALAVLGTSAVAAVAGAACVIGGVRGRSTTRLPARALLLVAWVFTAAAAFFIGGGFWRHYWLLFAAPVSALAGVAMSRIRKLTPIVLTALVAPCLAISTWVFVANFADHHRPGDRRHQVADRRGHRRMVRVAPAFRRQLVRHVLERRGVRRRASRSRLPLPVEHRSPPGTEQSATAGLLPPRSETRAALHRSIPERGVVRLVGACQADHEAQLSPHHHGRPRRHLRTKQRPAGRRRVVDRNASGVRPS